MTFNVYIYPEHALLMSVKLALANYPNHREEPFNAYIATGSSCVLSLQGALEAIINRLLETQDKIQHWDELRLASKIDTLTELQGSNINWGNKPWQEIFRLIRLRNWLAHNKDAVIGLTNSDGEWLLGGLKNKIPKIDPEKELLKESISIFYDSVREAGLLLSEMVGIKEQYEYLQSEKYEPRMVG